MNDYEDMRKRIKLLGCGAGSFAPKVVVDRAMKELNDLREKLSRYEVANLTDVEQDELGIVVARKVTGIESRRLGRANKYVPVATEGPSSVGWRPDRARMTNKRGLEADGEAYYL